MAVVRVRFVRENDLSSLLIRWHDGTLGRRAGRLAFSHVGLITTDGTWELGARVRVDRSRTGDPGIQYRPAEYAEFADREEVRIECTQAEHDAVWSAGDRLVGWPYSRRTILGFALGYQFRDEHGFVCSAFVPYCLYRAGMLPPELAAQERRMDPMSDYYLLVGMREGRRSAPLL